MKLMGQFNVGQVDELSVQLLDLQAAHDAEKRKADKAEGSSRDLEARVEELRGYVASLEAEMEATTAQLKVRPLYTAFSCECPLQNRTWALSQGML